jgi:hypothetical protein
MSFTDMMSSGRGPGVIGMVMALFVLIGFGLLFMFAFDEGFQGGELSIEGMIAQQAKEIQKSQGSIILGQEKLTQAPAMILKVKELASLKSKNQGYKDSIVNLTKAVETSNSKLVSLKKDFESYKDEYRAFVRGKAKGEERAKLETKDGTVYEDVMIRDVSAIGVQIRHRGGQKRIPFEELPNAMQDYFQYDPNQKAEAMASENAARAGHEAAVAVTDEHQKQLMAAARVREAEANKVKAAQAITLKTAQFEDLEDRIEQMEEAIELEGKKRLSRAGIMTVELANMRRQLTELRTQIATLQGQL